MTDGKDSEEKIADSQSDNLNSEEGKQSSEVSTDTVRQLQELQRKFDALSRNLQSEKDKGIRKTNERVDALEGSLKEVLQSALQSGKNISDVLSDLDQQEEREARHAMLEMSKAFREGRFPQPSLDGTRQGNGINVDAVLTELELDKNDIRVQAFQSRTFKSEAELALEAAKLQKSILKNQPSDADTATSQEAQRVQLASNQEKLQAEYTEGAKSLHGTALLNFKRDMRKKGWQGS